MPCYGYESGPGCDPRRWAKCLNDAAAAMIAEGWNKHAAKFLTVKHKRARRLFNER